MIEENRAKIDEIDRQIAKLLSERFELVNELGDYKKKNGYQVVDVTRECAVLKNVTSGSKQHLAGYIENIYTKIIAESAKLQKNSNLHAKPKVLVINGPNLNMLGKREKEHYGTITYQGLEKLLEQTACDLGLELEIFQSNSESEIISKVQTADKYAGLIINPAAYTHTSIAILDALLCIDIPKVEVHLSNIAKRDDIRNVSITAKGVDYLVAGMAENSYLKALEFLSMIL